MASTDLFAAALRLQQQETAYALVSVLRAQAPTSAKPGDKALVTADGIVHGWIGGGCAQPAVLRTVRLALDDGQARIIRIAPTERTETRELDEVLEFGMSCHSGGTLELFIDPMRPRTQLVVIGNSPMAAALAGLAPRVGLHVSVVAQGADAARFPDAEQTIESDEPARLAGRIGTGAFVVVATQGVRDLQGLRAALSIDARRIFFVASQRKAQVLKAALVEAGHDAAAVDAIVAPAGQAIGAQTPEEIALSVLAAVVAARRGVTTAPSARGAVAATAGAATPPLHALPPMPVVAGGCCGGGTAEQSPNEEHAGGPQATPVPAR